LGRNISFAYHPTLVNLENKVLKVLTCEEFTIALIENLPNNEIFYWGNVFDKITYLPEKLDTSFVKSKIIEISKAMYHFLMLTDKSNF
jgi:hypothetical protein